ncbi:hypothetical protein [Alloscardovia omnicolens]|uniref:hypothetical protein n=1 Tax=Alloscardovia omnicolens TaxID=419015 RepID=UPI003A6D666C
MMFFDSVQDILKLYGGSGLKPLGECIEFLEAYNSEAEKGNPYRALARSFEDFAGRTADQIDEHIDSDDYYFYKYLENLEDKNHYTFPLSNGENICVEINVLDPYENVNGQRIISPRWHLLISYYAYKDAAFNHMTDEYASQIRGIKGKLSKTFRCRSLNAWMREVANN